VEEPGVAVKRGEEIPLGGGEELMTADAIEKTG
jgi:hypothetical protein